MMSSKEYLLAFAAFIAGVGPAYVNDPRADAWPGWLIAGAVSVGVWIQAYATTNPRLQPSTPEQLLASVKRSELPEDVKEQAVLLLAQETVTSPSTEEHP